MQKYLSNDTPREEADKLEKKFRDAEAHQLEFQFDDELPMYQRVLAFLRDLGRTTKRRC